MGRRALGMCGDKHILLKPQEKWESLKLGAGPSPIKTDHGWLLIYHGVDDNHVYRGGAVLLDLENPQQIIARCPHPIIEPSESFETSGDVPNVVFPQGAVIKNDELLVYYGGGDRACCGARANFKQFVDYILGFK